VPLILFQNFFPYLNDQPLLHFKSFMHFPILTQSLLRSLRPNPICPIGAMLISIQKVSTLNNVDYKQEHQSKLDFLSKQNCRHSDFLTIQ